jgi:tetratricopeptide (TPR) repeat protein
MTENRRRALAESYFELGETSKAEAFYREWLKIDPRWGWGWIG